MAEPFLTVSLGEVRARGVRLQAEEATAIVLSLGERLGWRNPPRADVVLLTSNGRIDVRHVDEVAARVPCVTGYALLLHELLCEQPAAARGEASTRLHGVIARALADGDAPAPGAREAFVSDLRRLAPDASAETIVGVILRWADASAAAGPERRLERRAAGPNVSELRRQLRESDLHRYALLTQLTRMQPVRNVRGPESRRGSSPLRDRRAALRVAGTIVEHIRKPAVGPRETRSALPIGVPDATRTPVRVARTAAVACAAWLMGSGVDRTPPAGPHTRAIAEAPEAVAVVAPPIEADPAPPAEGVVLVTAPQEAAAPAHATVKRRASKKSRKSAAEPARTPGRPPNKFLRLVRRLFSA